MNPKSRNRERPGFDRRMTREEINALPIRRYGRKVGIVRTRQELDAAVGRLAKERVLGFDTETRPAFEKGRVYPPALVQLAGRQGVFVFQLGHLKFPPALRRLLADPDIIKAGVAPEYDVAQLKELGHFRDAGFVDLSEVARRAGIKNHGLRGLAAVLLGFRISKQAQRSNWARETLTPAQVIYAAMDAWVSRELYLRLMQEGGDGGDGR
jgi:ribonuclease D